MAAENEDNDSQAASKADSKASSGKRKSTKRRSSLFAKARQSFVISGGQRGASVDTLRGREGADFEGKAIVKRGRKPLCSCFGTSKREVYLMIKGPFLFVFANDKAQAPKYAVSLAHHEAVVHEERFGSTLVLLQDDLGDVDYELTFRTAEDPEMAKTFKQVVATQAAVGEAQEISKRLGHDKLLKKRASVRYAEAIALKKVDEQPDAPISSQEILDNVAAAGGNPYVAGTVENAYVGPM